MKKRVLSLLLCLVMALSLIPTVAFAGSGSTAITKVEVKGMQTLAAGEYCSTDNLTITATPANAYTVDRIWWYDCTAKDYPTSISKFKAGHSYRLNVKLSPRAGYYFSYAGSNEDYTGVATINGVTPLVAKAYSASGELWLQSTDMTATAPITKVEITGMQTPVVGQRCDTGNVTITTTPANAYTVEYIGWYDCTGNYPMSTDTFKAGHNYRLNVELSPKDGYYFEYAGSNEDYTGVATFNGKTAGVAASYQWGSSEIWLQSTDMTAVEHITHITEVNITGVKMPVAGGKVGDFLNLSTTDSAYVIREKDWLCVTDVEWLESNDVFEAGKEYLLHVVVRPADGYCMSEDTKLIFNDGDIGTDVTSYVDSDGTYIHGYTTDFAVTNGLAAPTVTLSATADGVTVKWNKISGATHYQVWRKTGTSSTAKWTLIKTAASGDTSYTNAGLTGGTKYQYKVRAIAKNSAGTIVNKSAYSAIKTKYFVAAPKISSITNTSTGITVKWNKITGATGYKLYRKAGSATTWTRVTTITDPSTVSYTDTGRTNGTKYQYKVVAVKTVSGTDYVGAYSNVRTMYRLTRPTISSATNSGAGKITLKWNKNDKATGYQVKYVVGSTTKTVKVASNATLSKTLSSLTKGSTYKVYVRSYKTVGSYTYYSAYSTAKSVKVVK